MLIYQIVLSFIMLSAIIRCDNFDAKLCGFTVWAILCVVPLIINYKRKQMTPEDIKKDIQKYKYKSIYFRHFGKLP